MEHQLWRVSVWRTDDLRQLFGACYGKMTRLDPEQQCAFHHSYVVFYNQTISQYLE